MKTGKRGQLHYLQSSQPFTEEEKSLLDTTDTSPLQWLVKYIK